MCIFPSNHTASFLVESPAFFSWLFSPCCQMHSTPAVRAILPAFYMVPALKRAQQSHGESAANRCNVVWTTPGLCGIIYHFHFLCYTVTATVNKQDIHKGERSSCSSAHILKLQQQWCVRVRVLSCEGKGREAVFERASSPVCTREWEKDPDVKLETEEGEGWWWWMEGLGWMWLERADVPVSNGWHLHTCPHAHVDTSILAHRSGRTNRFAQLCAAQTC